MGIPSYFVHVVRTYPNIVKLISELHKGVHNLYMDCNGIIYDAVRVHAMSDFKASGAFTKQDMYERAILNHVCDKITEYVAQVKPTNRVFLTFDGVAPVAKLNQQRERRYKSWLTGELQKRIEKKSASKSSSSSPTSVETSTFWNTSSITPGTAFMKKLNSHVTEYFKSNPKVLVSTSDVCGEGEHKMFQHIRDLADVHKNKTTIINLCCVD